MSSEWLVSVSVVAVLVTYGALTESDAMIWIEKGWGVLMQRSGSKELRVQPSPGGHSAFALPLCESRNEREQHCASPKWLSPTEGGDCIRHLQTLFQANLTRCCPADFTETNEGWSWVFGRYFVAPYLQYSSFLLLSTKCVLCAWSR